MASLAPVSLPDSVVYVEMRLLRLWHRDVLDCVCLASKQAGVLGRGVYYAWTTLPLNDDEAEEHQQFKYHCLTILFPIGTQISNCETFHA